MRIDKNGFTTYNNRLAYFDYYDKQTLYVFKDVSARRCVRKTYSSNWAKRVIFITNQMLMDKTHSKYDFHYFKEVRKIIFDGKLGTRYESKGQHSIRGEYFDCLCSHSTSIVPINKY